MGKPIPLLLLSDAVSSQTGLGRIARDLAVRIHRHLPDVFRLATAGYGSPGSRKFPWTQYNIEGMGKDWVIPSLPQVCDDFFGGEQGIVFSIWDATRLSWFSQPEMFHEFTDSYPGLQQWLLKQTFKKWLYAPIDASGPQDKLSFPVMKSLYGFDRLLAYTAFGEEVIRRTLGDAEARKRSITNLPHGIDAEVFYELPRALCRKLFFEHSGAQTGKMFLGQSKTPEPIKDDETLIGIVATNQARKDWALGIEAVSILAKQRKIRLWIHTDVLERYWSIPALLVDFGVWDNAIITMGYLSDEVMAEAYSACDLTFGIGPEGFGYPIAESLACGTPCITGSYAGGAEIVPNTMRVEPEEFHYEGCYAMTRPVFNPDSWADTANEWMGKRVQLNMRYAWENNWKAWEKYLRVAVGPIPFGDR